MANVGLRERIPVTRVWGVAVSQDVVHRDLANRGVSVPGGPVPVLSRWRGRWCSGSLRVDDRQPARQRSHRIPSGAVERVRGRREGRARRADVVDEENRSARNGIGVYYGECVGNVLPSFLDGEPGLGSGRPASAQYVGSTNEPGFFRQTEEDTFTLIEAALERSDPTERNGDTEERTTAGEAIDLNGQAMSELAAHAHAEIGSPGVFEGLDHRSKGGPPVVDPPGPSPGDR